MISLFYVFLRPYNFLHEKRKHPLLRTLPFLMRLSLKLYLPPVSFRSFYADMVNHAGQITCAKAVVNIDDADPAGAGVQHGEQREMCIRDRTCAEQFVADWLTPVIMVWNRL